MPNYVCPNGHEGLFTDRKFWIRPKCSSCGKRLIQVPDGERVILYDPFKEKLEQLLKKGKQ